MRIALFTGHRADLRALCALEISLKPEHQVFWMDRNRFAVTDEDAGASPNEIAGKTFQFVTHFLQSRHIDLVVIHGDRSEALAAAAATNMMRIPLAHLSGGDITEGSQDDSFRHAITKLAHLHYPSNVDSAERIIRSLGEEPWRVLAAGCPAIDGVMKERALIPDRATARRALGMEVDSKRCILVCYHPDTIAPRPGERTLLAEALTELGHEHYVHICGPNGDAGSSVITNLWQKMASAGPNVFYRPDTDATTFLWLMAHCDIMVGNSSAMFYEAPLFNTPCINIGLRQAGRHRPPNIIYDIPRILSAAPLVEAIEMTMAAPASLHSDQLGSTYYGDGHSGRRIADHITEIFKTKSAEQLRWKRFAPFDFGMEPELRHQAGALTPDKAGDA